MKLIVDIRNYACFEYDEYLYGGSPETNPYVLGQVVAIKEDNRSGEKGKETLGVVLGCITEHEVRTDAHGMVPLEDIRPATIDDFGKSNVSYLERLHKECRGLPVLRIGERKIAEDKQESLWYDGEIATVRLHGRTFSIEATGMIRIYVDKSGEGDFEDRPRYDNEDARHKCVKAGFNDDDLNNDQKVHWENNSWFAIRELDKDGSPIDDIAICHTYDEAIETAVEEMENPSKNLIIKA